MAEVIVGPPCTVEVSSVQDRMHTRSRHDTKQTPTLTLTVTLTLALALALALALSVCFCWLSRDLVGVGVGVGAGVGVIGVGFAVADGVADLAPPSTLLVAKGGLAMPTPPLRFLHLLRACARGCVCVCAHARACVRACVRCVHCVCVCVRVCGVCRLCSLAMGTPPLRFLHL